MPKFRKKPVVIEAEQFTDENKDRAFNFVTCNRYADFNSAGQPILKIQTLEGVMAAELGDWIIRGVAGEFYPCKAGIFEMTYEVLTAGDAHLKAVPADDFAELRAAVTGATPGPWHWNMDGIGTHDAWVLTVTPYRDGGYDYNITPEDKACIAAADPSTVAALLAAHDAAVARVAAVEAENDWLRGHNQSMNGLLKSEPSQDTLEAMAKVVHSEWDRTAAAEADRDAAYTEARQLQERLQRAVDGHKAAEARAVEAERQVAKMRAALNEFPGWRLGETWSQKHVNWWWNVMRRAMEDVAALAAAQPPADGAEGDAK